MLNYDVSSPAHWYAFVRVCRSYNIEHFAYYETIRKTTPGLPVIDESDFDLYKKMGVI